MIAQDKQTFEAVDAYVREQMTKARIPGLVLGIVRDGRTVHLEGFGRADGSGRPFTTRTPFPIGSVSKSFTALAVMQLAEAGAVDLDAPVQRYIPWFRVADTEASAKMTVRHLLNQTSGLSEAAGNEAFLDPRLDALEPAVRALATVPLARPLGTAAEYSNQNYTTLGLVVQLVAGESFESYVKRHIFEPLDMRHSYVSLAEAASDAPARGHRYWFGLPVEFDQPARGTVPTGGIVSTAEDMSHYLGMYLAGGRYGERRLLSAEGIAEMLRPAAPMTGRFHAAASYGMGWMVGPWGGVDTAYTFGDWTNSHAGMALDPAREWGVFVMFNVGLHGGAFPGLLAIEQGVLAMLLGRRPGDTGMDRLYLTVDSAVAAALASGVWSVARVVRRADRDVSALPLIWEAGVPAAVAVVPPRLFQVGWAGLRLYGPDIAYSLMAVAAAFGLAGTLRVAKMARRLRPARCADASA